MRHATVPRSVWLKRCAGVGLGGALFLGGYLTALWLPLHRADLALTPPVAEAQPKPDAAHQHDHAGAGAAAHQHHDHEVDLAPIMIRNAYHFATLYHAARAARWELAGYQAEELEENLTKVLPTAGTYAPFLQDFLKDYVAPLQKAIMARSAEQFRTTFQAAVVGCNDCHKATQHAFITIPQEPPALSIFVLPPATP